MHSVWLSALFIATSAFAQVSSFEKSYFDENLLAFLSGHREAYREKDSTSLDAKIEADFQKIQSTVEAYVSRHPQARIASCRFFHRGSYQFHFNGRRSAMLQEQQRLIQEAIRQSTDPESLAVYAGSATPVTHHPSGDALNGDEEDETFEQFRSRWKEKIQILYDHQNEVKQIKIASLHFKRWNVSRAQVEEFISKDLRVDLSLVVWVQKPRLNGTGQFFAVKNGPTNDPFVDLNAGFSVVNFQCSEQPIYRGSDNEQIGIAGTAAYSGKPVYTTLAELPTLYPQYRNALMLKAMFDKVYKIIEDPEFLELRQQIVDQTSCGVTMDFELRKIESELERLVPYVSSHIGLRISFVVQGRNEPKAYPIFHVYDVVPFGWHDLRETKDENDHSQECVPDKAHFIAQLKRILREEVRAGTFCTQPSRRHVQI